jgi:asparagine N-glycosylation enzyme membrane subunit Stt3
MIAYIYITASLLLYPIVGRIVVRKTNHIPKTQKRIIGILCTISLLVILGTLRHVVTISQNLNWFFVTSLYLTVSVLLWLTQSTVRPIIENIGAGLRFTIFNIGYLTATIGFFFVLLASFDLDTDQRKWLTEDLIYKERNIGQGPEADARCKKIEIYKTVRLFPILAYRIKAKTYEGWNLPLKEKLDVSFSNKNQILYLKSVVNGYKVFNFADTINLTDKNCR